MSQRTASIRPATTGVSLPDRRRAGILVLRIILYSLAIVVVAGLVTVLVLLFPALYGGYGSVVIVICFADLFLTPFVFLFLMGLHGQLARQRIDLADALTVAGHPGVDVLRLQRGRPAPSPQGVELRLRRERDGEGRRWLLVDAYAYAPLPRLAERQPGYSPSTRRR